MMGDGQGEWGRALSKAKKMVSGMSLEEKVSGPPRLSFIRRAWEPCSLTVGRSISPLEEHLGMAVTAPLRPWTTSTSLACVFVTQVRAYAPPTLSVASPVACMSEPGTLSTGCCRIRGS